MGIVALAALLVSASTAAIAQDQVSSRPASAGGDLERELRALQLLGRVPLRIWSIRAFNAAEVEAMLAAAGDSLPARLRKELVSARWWHVVPPEAGTILNTRFPYGFNDGPLWAGRGLTAFASAGLSARIGNLSARVDPIAFLAQNASFEPAVQGSFSLNTPYLNSIDLPERFGSSSYGRVDPGESELRFQSSRLAVGFSTASQVWGPAAEHPLILGNNAGGFPHAFVETARPLNARVASLHSRLIWGRLDGSAFGPPSADDRRFVTAAVGALSFPAIPGLEVGAARFFHSGWPSDGLAHAPFFNVFQGILKSSLVSRANPTGDVPGDNQLASLFFRWAFPRSGFEAYGEYGREDHNANIRDFWEEIDHDAGFLMGLQRVWTSAHGGIRVLRIEHLNTRVGKLHPTRPQVPWYIHGVRVQGHTERGQLLGSAGGFGGGATTIAFERLTISGRTTVRWDRLMRAEELTDANLTPNAGDADVIHAIGVEQSRDHSIGEITFGVSGAWEINRDFRADAFNLRASASYRFRRSPSGVRRD